MNDHASLLCHVNLANGFRGGERQTLLLVEALSEKGFKQKVIARKDSELVKRLQTISGIDVIEKNMFGFDAFSETSEKTLLHFHDSRSFPMFYLNGLLKSMKYIYTRRVQRSPKVNFMSKKIYKDSMKIVCLSSSIENTVKESFGKSIDSLITQVAQSEFYNIFSKLNTTFYFFLPEHSNKDTFLSAFFTKLFLLCQFIHHCC